MILGAHPFTIHINDIDVGLNDTSWKFLDDKGMVNIILSRKIKITSKEYPSKIVDWLYRWQMPFILAYGKLLQIRVGNGREEHEKQKSQGRRRSRFSVKPSDFVESSKVACSLDARGAD